MAKSTSALPILAGGAAVLLLSGKKKKKKTGNGGKARWGIRVSKDCTSVEVVNVELFNKFMFGAFNELVDIDPSLSLIQMSDALFGDIAPDCSGFPEEPESSEVAELYAVIARTIGRHMVNDPRVEATRSALIDDATAISFVDWYRAWRNYPSSTVPEAPSDQVAFSSDLSSYTIGQDWYPQNVLPFVADAAENGRLPTAFVDFVEKRGVLVGQFVKPISELSQSENSVFQFLGDLENAIAQATKEIVGA